MSFEMKYDRDGKVISQAPVEAAPQEVPEAQVPEIASPVEENLMQETQEIAQDPVKEAKELDKERNLRNLREKAERLERERDEAFKFAQELKSRYEQPKQESNSIDDDSISINPDDLVEGKHLNKFEKKIRKLEEQVKQYQQKTSEIALESQLKAQYPDFDKVVSRENIEMLRANDPDIAEAIHYTQDLHKKAVLAYKMIKKLGIAQEDYYVQEKAIAQKNAAKPKPLASINPQQGDSPLSHANAFANGLTDDLKKQLNREMMDARKRM